MMIHSSHHHRPQLRTATATADAAPKFPPAEDPADVVDLRRPAGGEYEHDPDAPTDRLGGPRYPMDPILTRKDWINLILLDSSKTPEPPLLG